MRTNKKSKFRGTRKTNGSNSNCKNIKGGKERIDSVMSTTDGANDPKWYTNNQQLVLDAGSFSFNTPAGAILKGLYPDGRDTAFAGIMSLRVLMTPGVSDDPFSPINIAARSMYDMVNYKNSRNFSYDAPDLMTYAYSVASAYSYWAWMQRTYGILNTYSQINRYIPDALCRAAGTDPDDIRLNMAQFRYYINLFARKINVLAVPAGMPIFERYMWLFTNIYMDSNNLKAGLYVMRPYGFYKFREDIKDGSAAQMVTMPKEYMKLSDIISYGDQLAEALLSSQDINNMSTDVLKAYEGNVMSLPDTPAEYGVIPVYNEAVLNQLHNAKAFGDFIIDAPSQSSEGVYTLGSSGNLVQDATSGHLLYSLELSDNTYLAKLKADSVLLDTGIENPTPEDVFEMTRLIPMANLTSGNLEDCGADIIVDYSIYTIAVGTKGAELQKNIKRMPTYTFIPETMTQGVYNVAEMCDEVTKFDWHPFIYITIVKSDQSISKTSIVGDTYNYTTISRNSLAKLHEAALLSMFTLPNALGSK